MKSGSFLCETSVEEEGARGSDLVLMIVIVVLGLCILAGMPSHASDPSLIISCLVGCAF